MNTKISHTTGPWRIHTTTVGGDVLRTKQDGDWATDLYSGRGKNSQCVAVIVQASVRNVAEAIANARLMEVAPELLCELERITEKFCNSEAEVTLEDFDACKQVIAKAKGQ